VSDHEKSRSCVWYGRILGGEGPEHENRKIQIYKNDLYKYFIFP